MESKFSRLFILKTYGK